LRTFGSRRSPTACSPERWRRPSPAVAAVARPGRGDGPRPRAFSRDGGAACTSARGATCAFARVRATVAGWPALVRSPALACSRLWWQHVLRRGHGGNAACRAARFASARWLGLLAPAWSCGAAAAMLRACSRQHVLCACLQGVAMAVVAACLSKTRKTVALRFGNLE
jgi:hypothetical protein